MVPLLLMMYLNTIFCYGTDRFFAECQESGIDGVIVPDIPYEEKDEIQGSADKYNVHNISLVTPASEDRIQMIASEATGFLYCVSSNGVTGVRASSTPILHRSSRRSISTQSTLCGRISVFPVRRQQSR